MNYIWCLLGMQKHSKTGLKQSFKKKTKIGFQVDYRLMQVKSIAECSQVEHSAIILTFIKLPFAIKTFVFSILEWPLKTGFTVYSDF